MQGFILAKVKFYLSFVFLLFFGMFLTAGRVDAVFVNKFVNKTKQTAQRDIYTVEDLLKNPPELVGDRVTLRATEEKDVEALSKILCSYDEKEIKFLFEPNSKKFKNEKEAEAFINGRLADKNDLVYTIMSGDKKGEQEVAGLLSVSFQQAKAYGSDFGYVAQFFIFIDKNKANEKIGTAAEELIVDLICKVQNVALFIDAAWVENEVGVKMVKKLVEKLSAKLKDSKDQSVSVSVPYIIEKKKKGSGSAGKKVVKKHKIHVGLVVHNKLLNSVINLLKRDKKAYDDVVEEIVKGFVGGKMSDKDFWSKICKQVDLKKFFSFDLGSFFGVKKVDK